MLFIRLVTRQLLPLLVTPLIDKLGNCLKSNLIGCLIRNLLYPKIAVVSLSLVVLFNLFKVL